jgi:hypothetical protein
VIGEVCPLAYQTALRRDLVPVWDPQAVWRIPHVDEDRGCLDPNLSTFWATLRTRWCVRSWVLQVCGSKEERDPGPSRPRHGRAQGPWTAGAVGPVLPHWGPGGCSPVGQSASRSTGSIQRAVIGGRIRVSEPLNVSLGGPRGPALPCHGVSPMNRSRASSLLLGLSKVQGAQGVASQREL